MKIIRAFPPNYADICAVFPIKGRPNVIFAWADTLFNPGGGAVSESLMAHEAVHGERQNGNPAAWWDRYLALREFRRDEEITAHRVEWRTVQEGYGNRHMRRAALSQIAARLASPMYGLLMTKSEAVEILTSVTPSEPRHAM